MRLRRALCAFLVVAVAELASAAPPDTCAAGPAAEMAIRRVLEDFGSAYVGHDIATLEKVFGEDFTASRPGRENVMTRADFIESVKTDKTKNVSITRADEKIRQYGYAAVFTYRVTRLADDGPHVYRASDVLNFRDGRWQGNREPARLGYCATIARASPFRSAVARRCPSSVHGRSGSARLGAPSMMHKGANLLPGRHRATLSPAPGGLRTTKENEDKEQDQD